MLSTGVVTLLLIVVELFVANGTLKIDNAVDLFALHVVTAISALCFVVNAIAPYAERRKKPLRLMEFR